jgi:predicted N-acetyltransferase YhbS
LPGLPANLGSDAFFLKRRFKTSQAEHDIYDLAADLQAYTPVPNPHLKDNPQVRRLRPGEEGDLREFLQKEFSGRWLYEFEEYMRQGDSVEDYMVIWTEQGIEAFSLLTTEKSQRPLNRYYMHNLPRPWGQLGSVGVSERCRGRGYGVLIVDTALQTLAKMGVRSCVVDWTGLTNFYQKFGFEPFRQYHILYKELI